MSNRKKALEAMLESLIKNDNEKAAGFLHDYITAKTREMMLGEKDDEDSDSDDDDSDDKEEKSDDDDSGSDEKEEKKSDDSDSDSDDDGDSDSDDDDDDDDDKGDDDDGKPAFLKKKEDVKESAKKGYTEAPPKAGKQPMTGVGKGNKFSKYQNPKGTMDEKTKGDSLKGKGSAKGKAFMEKPKSPPNYKDGVDHAAGGIKNRSKSG